MVLGAQGEAVFSSMAIGGPALRTQALVLAVGVFVAGVTTRSTLPAHRWWGWIALAGYGIATLVAVSPARRWWPVVALLGAGLAPLAVLVVGRARGWQHVAQSEVDVIEAAAQRLLRRGTPYLGISDMTPAERVTHYSYVPYLPPISMAGLPRAVFGSHALTDARLWLAAGDLVVWSAIWRRADHRTRACLALIATSPLVTLPMAVGGHDVLIASLLVLGAIGARTAIGAAAGMTYLTWPLIVPLVPTIRGHRVRVAAIVATGAIPVVVNPRAAYENLILFPFGRTPARSPADAPSIGRLLNHLPGGRLVDLAALAFTVVVIVWLTLVDPASNTAESLSRGAIGFAVLIALVPSSRVGYLLYPVTFWAMSRTLAEPPLAIRPRSPRRSPHRSASE